MEKKMYENLYRLDDRHWWFRARKEIVLRFIAEYFRPNTNCRVFDIGCGTGMILRELSKYGEAWGIDIDEGAAAYAKKKNPSAKIIRGLFPENAPQEQFDLVTALDVLEHISDDEAALDKISGILKPGGIAVITVPAYEFLWTGHDIASHHKRRYGIKEFENKLKKAGLQVEKISYFNTFLFLPIAGIKIIQRLLFSGEVRSHLDSKLPPALANNLLKTIFSSEKHFLPYINFPFGISIVAIVRKL